MLRKRIKLILGVIVVGSIIALSNQKTKAIIENNDNSMVKEVNVDNSQLDKTTKTQDATNVVLNEDHVDTSSNNIENKLTRSEEYIIKDQVLRTLINKRLGKTGALADTYNATLSELETITTLDILAPSNVPKNIVKIDSFEGIEKLSNLTRLTIYSAIIPEEALVNIGQLTKLTFLNFNSVIFSGDSAYPTQRLNSQINSGSVEAILNIPFDNSIDLSPLAQITGLQELYVGIIGTKEVANMSHAPRTHFVISELGRLTNLKTLSFEIMASVDDPSFSFITNLTKLTKLTLTNVPLNDVSAIASLPLLTSLSINETYVTDFTPVIDKTYFTGVKNMYNKIPTQYYELVDVSGVNYKKVSLKTGIKVNGPISAVTFSTVNGFQGTFTIDSYQIIDGELVVDFLVKNTLKFKKYNWETGISELDYSGIVYGVSFTSSNNKKFAYTANAFNIGKTVTFDANYENGPTLDKQFNPLDKIILPTVSEIYRLQYNLIGWSTDKEGLQPFDINSEVVDNITLYAQWSKKLMYTVNFDNDGVVASISVEEGTKISKPNDPLKKGYTFEGWFIKDTIKKATIDQAWNFDVDLVNSDLTLYAKWTKVKEVVIVDNNKPSIVVQTGSNNTILIVSLLLTSISFSAGLRFRKFNL